MDQRLFNRFKEKVLGLSGEVFYAKDRMIAGDFTARILQEMKSPVIGVAGSPLVNECHIPEYAEKAGEVIYENNLKERCDELNIGISEMEFAVAETGTLVQDATGLEKRIVSMLPEVHIALVRAQNIVSDIGDALNIFYRQGNPPGYIAFISGPSRTADIERVLTIGVHGPARLIVIVVGQGGEGKERAQKRVQKRN